MANTRESSPGRPSGVSDDTITAIGDRATFVLNMSRAWRELREQNYNEEEIARRRWRDFCNLQPPVFEGEDNPEMAARWLRTMEHIFERINCPEALKMNYATHQLVGEALTWWRGATTLLQALNADLTWTTFRRTFLDKYFPRAVRKEKHTELLTLRQDNMSVDEYIAKFEQLMEYANLDRAIYDEEWKTEKFESGLRPEIRKLVVTCANSIFPELDSQSRQAERTIAEAKPKTRPHTQPSGGSRVRRIFKKSTRGRKGKSPHLPARTGYCKKNTTHGQSSVGRRTLITCATCGRNHSGVCRRGSESCFRCGQTGHFISSCPYARKAIVPPFDGNSLSLLLFPCYNS